MSSYSFISVAARSTTRTRRFTQTVIGGFLFITMFMPVVLGIALLFNNFVPIVRPQMREQLEAIFSLLALPLVVYLLQYPLFFLTALVHQGVNKWLDRREVARKK